MGKNEFLDVLTEMVTFVRVAESGSFSAAARFLHITPSAVSKQVTRLERVLGAQLIRRTTRQLQLTDVGMEAFHKCSELVEAAQGAMQVTAKFMERPQGMVRLTAPKAFAKHILHPAILDFLDKYPEVDVQLIVTDKLVDPIQEGVDLVVQLTKVPPLNLASRPLMEVEHILCASPKFLKNNHPIKNPKDLVGINCLYLGERDRDNWWRFKKGNEVEDVVVKGRYVANHSEMRLEAVLRGVGVGCVPDFVARSALRSGAVQRILPEWELEANYHGTAHILYPPNRFLAPKCRVLIDFLVEHVAARMKAA
ncbi:LysR family transcriptional regulator [Rhodoferax sp. GW822-FHT02A01]|uniref:LysR family transcriptional regulator n=1 Tax=Rhodoferax sp. GW822-FHT02A01 TaxID=3141537 RepID=UPI00315C9635